MATSVGTGAIYDLATYDSGVTYDSSGVTITPDGVSGTGQITTASIIGDALFSVEGTQAIGQVGSILFPGVVIVPSVQATGEVTAPSVSVSDVATLTGVEAGANVGEVSLNIDINVTGEAGTTALGNVVVTGTSLFEATGLSATASLGTPTVTTTSVIFDVADRSHRREVYVPRAENRVVYVEAA